MSVPTSTKPNPKASVASNASAFLSKPAARPTGLGKSSPKTFVARRGSSGAGSRLGKSRSAAIVRRCASSASARAAGRSRRRRNIRSWREARKVVVSVGVQRQRLDPGDGGERQFTVKMGEEFAAARNLPFQRVAKPRRVDGDEQQVALDRRNAARLSPAPGSMSKNG